jgi:sensor domain CHASE-containing protein
MDTLDKSRQLLELPLGGAITLELVYICFAVACVAVGITLWTVWTFQTKSEAKELENRFDSHVGRVESNITSMRDQIKSDMDAIWEEVNVTKKEFSNIARDVAYIRGRLEPKS